MHCKSTHCECTDAARPACDARLTRASIQEKLDDYDNRIKCLQAGRANIQRTLDELPVEVRPDVLAALHKRSELLADIEQVVQRCHRPNDPRQCGQALLEYLRARPNLFTGIRF